MPKKRKGPKPSWVYLASMARRVFRWSEKHKLCWSTAKACYICGKKAKKYEVEHVIPVGTRPTGYEGWDAYYKRMFEGEIKPACKPCHAAKSRSEAAERAKIRRAAKRDKTK